MPPIANLKLVTSLWDLLLPRTMLGRTYLVVRDRIYLMFALCEVGTCRKRLVIIRECNNSCTRSLYADACGRTQDPSSLSDRRRPPKMLRGRTTWLCIRLCVAPAYVASVGDRCYTVESRKTRMVAAHRRSVS